MTPEAKKRMEGLAKINEPTDLNFQCDDWKCCAKQSFNLGFQSGYQAGMQDPDANKELLDECEKVLWTYQNMGGAERRNRLRSLLEKLKAARGGG